MVIDILYQSVIYIPLILGIFLSFKILRLTDLTADGSFVLGGGLYARLIMEGYPQGICVLAGLLSGGIIGLVLASIQKDNRVSPLLASILCVFMLQSVNILVMGRSNIALLGKETCWDTANALYPLLSKILGWGAIILLILGFIKILQSKIGLIARAFGLNDQLLKKRGYPAERVRKIGLMCSNILYALSGILCVQTQKFADIGMGMGVSLIGIGAVIIGGQLLVILYPLRKILNTSYGINFSQGFRADKQVFACILGITSYFGLTRFLLSLNLDPSVIKLISGMILTFLFTCNLGQMIYDRHSAH